MRSWAYLVLIILLTRCLLQPVRASGDPALRGPYKVGVSTLEIPHTRPGESGGSLQLFLWYPAAPEAHQSADSKLAAVMNASLAKQIGKMPVLLFSHGACALPADYTWLITHLASYGWLVVAPLHAYTNLELGSGCGTEQAKQWSSQARLGEMTAALDAVIALNRTAGAVLEGHINEKLIALAGHSLGGQTVLRVASAEQRVSSVVAMAPVTQVGLGRALEQNSLPTLIEGGGRDTVLDPAQYASAYEKLHDTRYLLYLFGGNHSSWGNVCTWDVNCDNRLVLKNDAAHPIILRTTLAFLYRHTLNDHQFDPYLVTKTETLYELKADN